MQWEGCKVLCCVQEVDTEPVELLAVALLLAALLKWAGQSCSETMYVT